MEFFQNHMTKGHGNSGICTLFRVQPHISQLGRFTVVRRNDHTFSTLVANLREEVSIRGTGLWHIRAPQNKVVRVIPISRLRHICLLTPDHRWSRRQITIPIIEAHTHATDQWQVARARSIRNHRHSRNRRETNDSVRAMFFRRVNIGCGNHFVHFVPRRANKSTHTSFGLIRFSANSVFYNKRPSIHRIFILLASITPQFQQRLAHFGILNPVCAVDIPRIAGTTRATTRFVIW